jgi:catechol 2,3-dioxygenase-like lactoylglutathione lyase family enzyme
MQPEPIFDLAHLGHMELLTPKPDESLKFFVDVMGMTISGRKGESVYLRGWDDYERYSLKLTASKTSGMEHMALRARSPQALERRVAALKGSGFEIGWTDGDMGQGPAFRCRDPDGHIVELYYETEWYEPPPELKPALKNQAQRFPARGVNVRRLDHLNCLAVDIKANRIFFEKYLGCRLTEQIVLNDGTEAAMWMTMSNKSYDFAYSHDHSNTPGPFSSCHLRARQPRGCAARRRYLPGERRLYRDRPAQARHPADILPLCLRARRQPRRSRQRRRPSHPRARLEADRVDRGRAQEGPGVGAEDDRVVSYPWDTAGVRGAGLIGMKKVWLGSSTCIE